MKHIPIYIATLIFAFSCAEKPPQIKTGDLLFQVGAESAMSRAITTATQSDSTLNFTHVGIAIATSGADSVLEATSDGGVRIVALETFLEGSARIGDHPAVVAMRLRDTSGLAASVNRARNFIGLPYDYVYRPDNNRMYCSELVWESYRDSLGERIFPARPMNFRTADGTMPVFWIELFAKMGEPIPEGVPGTNPNDMARDPHLEEIGRWF